MINVRRNAIVASVITAVLSGCSPPTENPKKQNSPPLYELIDEDRPFLLSYVQEEVLSNGKKRTAQREQRILPSEERFAGIVGALRYGRFSRIESSEWTPIKGSVLKPTRDIWLLTQDHDADSLIIAVYPSGYLSTQFGEREITKWRGMNLRAFLPMAVCPHTLE